MWIGAHRHAVGLAGLRRGARPADQRQAVGGRPAHGRRKGELLKERLEEINSPHVLEVRGRGLLLGLQLDIPAGDVVKAGFAHGLVLVNAGPDVLRLAPPLVITDAELDTVVERLDAILKTW